MESHNLFKLAKNKAKIMILTGFFIGALSFLFLVLTQPNFKASSDVLITQNQEGFKDYYTLSKSAEYLSGVLIESVYSEKFIEEVENANLVSSRFLPVEKLEKIKTWSKIVKISKNANVGIIRIEVFAESQKKSIEISNAMLSVLANKNDLFLGKGQSIEVKVLSGPIWEKNPSLQNIFLAMFGGFLVGLIFSFIIFYFKEEEGDTEILLQKIRNAERAKKEMAEYQESLKYLEK